MPQSFVCLNTHIIFSTKNREPLIMPDLAPRLYQYMGGICRETGNRLIGAGGMPDHVHLIDRLTGKRNLRVLRGPRHKEQFVTLDSRNL